jgi:hypothetical protein
MNAHLSRVTVENKIKFQLFHPSFYTMFCFLLSAVCAFLDEILLIKSFGHGLYPSKFGSLTVHNYVIFNAHREDEKSAVCDYSELDAEILCGDVVARCNTTKEIWAQLWLLLMT